ncbi:MAG TPA: Zn-ribbon domain-containing OB-fold protein [Candidatus Acidoferrales bacterium]|nr:Zn-ribbon domain-containing OB-fold protein [Candidatus Acidoferrales bacterium]
MSQQTAPQSAGKKARPIVPFLRLGDNGEKPYLVGKKCGSCGAVYLGRRVACSKCSTTGPFNEIRLSDKGSLWVYSIVHQSAPGIPTPYVAAIVDLPEGASVRCTLIDVEPNPGKLPFGMPVEMVTKKVREDKEGNDVIAFFFRPAK